jgi:hypothetical protein
MPKIHKLVLALIATVSLPTMAFATVGSVTLSYAPLSSNVVSPGSSVPLSLSLVVNGFSGADAVGGFDFLLTSVNSPTGQFFIQSRTTDVNGAFPDSITVDGLVAARPGASLNPTNDFDLGQAVDVFPEGAVQDGTYHLADYVIGVDVGVAPGNYDFETLINLWSDQNGDDHLLNAGTFTLVVVPEPSTWSLLGVGGLAGFGFIRSRRRHS